MKRSHILLPFFLTLLVTWTLISCGPADSTVNETRDTITTQAPIRFNAASSQIEILEPGPNVSSSVITPCEIGFEAVNVTYELVGTDQLKIDDNTLTYVRPLTTQPQVAGVPDKLFGVWQLPSRVFEGVTFTIEIEIQASKLIYRNTCVR